MLIVIYALSFIIMGSCAPKRVNYNIDEEFKSEKPKKIAVIPFYKGKNPGPVKDDLKCEVCKLVYTPEEIAENADVRLTRFLREALSTFQNIDIIPEEKVHKKLDIHPMDPLLDTPYSISLRVGRETEAEGVLVGTISRYKERKGSAAGSTSPASVVFSLFLIRVRDGKILWKADFGETQRSLLENLLDISTFFKRGGRWLTADELASYGVREVLKTLPL